MVIATFGPSTGWAGKTITYENDQFTLEGHGAITAADVLTYERQGQISWAYEGLREWVEQLAARGVAAAPQAHPIAATPPPTGNEVTTKPKRPLYRRWWVIVVGVFVLLIVIGAIANAVSPPKKTPAVAVQPVAITPSPVVTVTKTATPSPTPLTVSAAESTYASDIASDSKTVGKALASVSKVATNYTGSTSQKTTLVVAMATIKVVWDRWKHRSAPAPRWKVAHRHWLAALRDYDTSMTLLARGIDNNNVAYVNEAVRYMNAGKRQANLATASMQTIMAELGL